MKLVVKRTAAIAVAIAAILLFAAFAIAWSGTFNVAADGPHLRPVYAAINFVREQSVRARAANIKVPDLANRAFLVKGAGNYDAMCAQCHLSPGMGETELSRGLFPAPPNLSNTRVETSRAFWSIKHGIKASACQHGEEYERPRHLEPGLINPKIAGPEQRELRSVGSKQQWAFSCGSAFQRDARCC